MEDLWIENQLLRDFALRKLPPETGLFLKAVKRHPDWRKKAHVALSEQWKVLEEAFRATILEDMPTIGKPG